MTDTSAVIMEMKDESNDLYLAKANSNGDTTYTSPTIPDSVHHVKISLDGDMYVYFGYTGIIHKYTKNLEFVWQVHEYYDYYGTLYDDYAADMGIDEDGNAYVVWGDQGVIKKLNSADGAELWSISPTWSNGDSISMNHILVDQESDAIYLAPSNPSNSDESVIGGLQKYNKSGSLQWRRIKMSDVGTWNTSWNTWFLGDMRGIDFDHEKKVVVGRTFDGWRRKYDSSGSHNNWWETNHSYQLFFLHDGSFVSRSIGSYRYPAYFSSGGDKLRVYDSFGFSLHSFVASTDGKEALVASRSTTNPFAMRINIENLGTEMPVVWELRSEEIAEYNNDAFTGGLFVAGAAMTYFWTANVSTVEVEI